MNRKTRAVQGKPVPVLVGASLSALGGRLAQARKSREMTQEDLANVSDVGVSTVRSLEAGADGVSVGNLVKVLRGLGLLEQMDLLLDPARDPEVVNYALRKLGGLR